MFGPFSVMIQALIVDVGRFFVIMMIFMFGFLLQTCVIYRRVYSNAITDTTTNYARYNTFYSITEEMFYGILGMGNKPEMLSEEDLKTNPEWTYYLDIVCFALYQIVALVILVNLLIAMMGSTYNKLVERSTVEWKNLRAIIIRNMSKPDQVPVPVNVFMTLMLMGKVIVATGCCCCKLHQKGGNEEDDSISEMGGLHGGKRVETIVNWRLIANTYLESKGINTLSEMKEELEEEDP